MKTTLSLALIAILCAGLTCNAADQAKPTLPKLKRAQKPTQPAAITAVATDPVITETIDISKAIFPSIDTIMEALPGNYLVVPFQGKSTRLRLSCVSKQPGSELITTPPVEISAKMNTSMKYSAIVQLPKKTTTSASTIIDVVILDKHQVIGHYTEDIATGKTFVMIPAKAEGAPTKTQAPGEKAVTTTVPKVQKAPVVVKK